MNASQMIYNVGFITFGDDVLMLHRKKAPNKGKWNGVGGHIEKGESPYQSMVREIKEETGLVISSLRFGGILTWEGYEIEPGGLYIFSAAAESREVKGNGEGILAWKPKSFATSAEDVVDNIHIFLPPVLSNAKPCHYHFIYNQGQLMEHVISNLPDWVDIYRNY
jgi:8-oxo-dGTP diphosphatase